MNETMKAIAIHVGLTYSGQMQAELRERKRIVIPEPEPPKAAQEAHKAQVASWQDDIDMEIKSLTDTIADLEALKTNSSVVVTIRETKLKIAKLEKARKSNPPELVLTGKDLKKYNSDWKRYTSQVEQLDAHRMQVASLILGQITPALLTRLEQLPDWEDIRSAQDPLQLYDVIERAVWSQTKDAYPYKIAMDYFTTFCNYRQPANLQDAEYSDKFNTMASILESVSLTLSHQPSMLNYISQELYGKDFDDLSDVGAIEKVIEDNQERFLAYCMIRFSNQSHAGLRDSLHNDFIQGSKRYPKKRSGALLLLEQTTKTPTVSSVSEGSSFAQKGGHAKNKSKSKSNKNPWANKECTHCGKKGHRPPNGSTSSRVRPDQGFG
jgi:hypothetical protein